MTEPTTPTGVPIRMCDTCGVAHPTTRRHCVICGRPSAFIAPDGVCIYCRADLAAITTRGGEPA